MKKFAVHPAFIAFAVLLVATDKSLALFNTVFCCIFHELGHMRAAETRGYRLNRLVLMPYGAMVAGGETLHPSDEVAISLWGPAINFIFAAILIAFWWIIPQSYLYTKMLATQNLAIGVFNLLPLYPLDMSRIILAKSKNKQKTLTVLRIFGILSAASLFVLFAISIFYKINFSLFVAGLMFLAGAVSGIKTEQTMYSFNTAFLKDDRHPVEKRCYLVNETLPISRILRLLSPSATVQLEVLSTDGKPLAQLSEAELVDRAARAPAGATIGALLFLPPSLINLKKTTVQTIVKKSN